MDFLITLAVGGLGGVIATVALAKYYPTLFVDVEEVASTVLAKVQAIANKK